MPFKISTILIVVLRINILKKNLYDQNCEKSNLNIMYRFKIQYPMLKATYYYNKDQKFINGLINFLYTPLKTDCRV